MTAGTQDVATAVVTGGHSYDVPGFHRLFRAMDGVDAYVQPMDDFAASPEAVRDAYGAVVFYIMLGGAPTDEGLAWWQGKPRAALERLAEAEQGVVVLHHAILAYRDWPPWSRIVGIPDRSFEYHIGETVTCDVADAGHPITAGLASWTMIDETYSMADAGEGSHVLITTEHSPSMRTIAWTRQRRRSRVFCYESGHDERAWSQANFREVLRRGILWAAGRM
jgi:hypothetical protein